MEQKENDFSENIEGSLIVVFNKDTLKDQRTMLEVGIAGEDDFSTFKYKKDIPSSENQNFKYEIICTKEELENNIKELETLTQTENFLYKKFEENGGTHQSSFNTGEKIRKISSNLGNKYIKKEDTYAYLKKENGEIIDLSEHINLYQSEIRLPPLFEKGVLKTNVDTLHLSKNNFTSIEAHNATWITDLYGEKESYPRNTSIGSPLLESVNAPNCKSFYIRECDKLNKIYAPNCKELYIENCPELKEENMELSYDCQIEGLEKKNQLKR